jgi:uncharacterized protein YbjT (DUF2867 family)
MVSGMQKGTKILLAGATGYLGRFVTRELVERGYQTRIVVRNKEKHKEPAPNLEVVEAQVTQPQTLQGICDGIDAVISTVGITRQKDGLTYMDVDFQANANLIDEAIKSQAKKFIYISVLNGEKIRHLKGGEAKERLGDYLKESGLDYCIIRPNGFFSDMGDFLKMAKGGKVYLFGDGELKINPIHGKDLAKVVVDAIDQDDREINVGGPDMLSQNDIGALALKALGKPVKIVYLPDWIRRAVLWSIRTLTGQKTYGPIEFFMTTMVMEMQAPQYGTERLEDFFNREAKKMKG